MFDGGSSLGLQSAFGVIDKKKKADDAAFGSFMDNKSLIDNPDQALLAPKFQLPGLKDNKKRTKEIEGMMALFNNRKKEILDRKIQPGISQIRLDL
jgi:hypothetical protein